MTVRILEDDDEHEDDDFSASEFRLSQRSIAVMRIVTGIWFSLQ